MSDRRVGTVPVSSGAGQPEFRVRGLGGTSPPDRSLVTGPGVLTSSSTRPRSARKSISQTVA